MEKFTTDYWKERNVKVLNEKPKGWIKNEGARTAPNGYSWYNNGQSLFGGNYDHALVKDKGDK